MNYTMPYMMNQPPFFPMYPQNNNQNYISYLENKINELEKRVKLIEDKINKNSDNNYQSSIYMM